MNESVLQIPWEGALPTLTVLARCSGFVLAAPVIGDMRIPARFRVAIGLLLTMILSPIAPPAVDGVGPLATVAAELLVGVLIGMAGRLVIDAILYAGGIASFPAGMAIAKQLDPVTQVNIPILGGFYRVLGTTVYLAIGGHHALIAGLARSYEIVQPGNIHLSGEWLAPVVSMTGRVIVIGFRVAAPIFISGLLVNLFLMLIARAVPQMHILIVGAPIKLSVGLLSVAFSVHVIVALIDEGLTGSLRDLWTLLRLLAA